VVNADPGGKAMLGLIIVILLVFLLLGRGGFLWGRR
jgi:hypothetical protein